jgi:hypothetical protein
MTAGEPEGKRKGRQPGAVNYSDDEIDMLLDLVETHLPIGQEGWNEIEREYAVWAKENERVTRNTKSLENKYKSVSY